MAFLFGAAYYPEHRNPKKWAYDLEQMAKANVTCLRVGEFAWFRFEPAEAKYEFSWMDEFLELAVAKGIKLLMCPPLRTLPAWLVEQDRSLLIENSGGVVLEYGSRYTFCINHPLLKKKGRKMAAMMAKHWGNNPNIAGWHLDNEHGDEPDCHCPICKKKFQTWCSEKYTSITNLNEKWGLAFWGLQFDDWSQIPTPRTTKAPHSPAFAGMAQI